MSSAAASIAVLLAVLVAASDAVPYSKYGRSCKDIGCRSNEVCVMAEDPCSRYQSDNACGRYPTCQRSSDGGESCTTKICPSGQYCKTENGRPTCVNTTPGLEYDSAGIASVNGQRTNSNQPSVPADRYAPANPYAGANAPPAEDVNHGHNQPSYANNNPVYPPYPTANNNNNNNYGYPAYPSGNNNPQPNNRPAVDQYGYPIYPPATSRPSVNDNRGYHNNYPQHNMPQHNTGWSNSYPNTIYRRNGASAPGLSTTLLMALCAFSLRIARA